MTSHTLTTPAKTARVFKRLGAGAFLFFAIKGILWLTVPPIVAHYFR
jgi:hypothetical protein